MKRHNRITLACTLIAVIATLMPGEATAGPFGLFKRCKKKTVCCPQPPAPCCPVMASDAPTAVVSPPKEDEKSVIAKVCLLWEGETFWDAAPQKTGTGTCDDLLVESFNAYDSSQLPSGVEICGMACYAAEGCPGTFTCPTECDCLDRSDGVQYQVKWIGIGCDGCCVEGSEITGSNRCKTIEIARLFMLQKAKQACCPQIVRCCYTIKVLD